MDTNNNNPTYQRDAMQEYSSMYDQAPSNSQFVDVRDLQNFDYQNPMVKGDFSWWADDSHPGVRYHREKSKQTFWHAGRRIAYGTSECQTAQDCYDVNDKKKCDPLDGNIARECLSYEGHQVKCAIDKNNGKGYCIIR